MLSNKNTLVIGLGTGRCGTKSLATLLDSQDHSEVYHERHGCSLPWHDGEGLVSELIRWSLSNERNRYVGDVSFSYLPYCEYILERVPSAKFICIKRDRAQTIASYLAKTPERNHWTQHDGKTWEWDRWDHCYPKYEAADKTELIGAYWDEYYSRADDLADRHASAFKVFAMEKLNNADGQRSILAHTGLKVEEMTLEVGVHKNKAVQRAERKSRRIKTKVLKWLGAERSGS